MSIGEVWSSADSRAHLWLEPQPVSSSLRAQGQVTALLPVSVSPFITYQQEACVEWLQCVSFLSL